MQELFKAAVERGASDIHIKAGDFIRDCIKDPDRIDEALRMGREVVERLTREAGG